MRLFSTLKAKLKAESLFSSEDDMLFEDENEWRGWWNWIQLKYWHMLPYNWRPGQILYRLKCFFFKRYTTIRPRTLNYHTWCDRSELLPHMMFEILSRFIEQECSPGHVEWYGEYGHKIMVNGEEKYVRDEMQELYDWWHKVYLKEIPEKVDKIWDQIHENRPEYLFKKVDVGYEYDPRFEYEDQHEKYDLLIKQINEIEHNARIDLEDRLIRMVRLIPFMWT